VLGKQLDLAHLLFTSWRRRVARSSYRLALAPQEFSHALHDVLLGVHGAEDAGAAEGVAGEEALVEDLAAAEGAARDGPGQAIEALPSNQST
jgi:hypothetical protein